MIGIGRSRKFLIGGENSGFDVVIGNPPWGAKVPKEHKTYIKNRFLSKQGEVETYIHFIDISINHLLKQGGFLGLITPNTWYYLDKYIDIRKCLINYNIKQLIEMSKNIFRDAPDIVPAIFLINKSKADFKYVETLSLNHGVAINNISDTDFELNQVDINNISKFDDLLFNLKLTCEISNLLEKISFNSINIGSVFNVRYGIKTGNNSKYVKKEQENNDWKLCISSASSVKRYSLAWENDYIYYGRHLAGYSDNSFEVRKILIQYIRKLSMPIRLVTAFDKDGIYYPLNNFSFIEEKNDSFSLLYAQSIINSKLMNFYFKNRFIDYNIKPKYIEKLPIKQIPLSEQQPFIALADQMLSLNEQLQLIQSKFVRLLERKFEIEPSKALLNWQNLSFKEFVKELAKKKVKLSLADEVEWEEFFLAEQQKALSLQADIDSTDHTIDAKVYALYGLDEDEIALIESC